MQDLLNERERILLKEHEFYLSHASASQFYSILKTLDFRKPEDLTILYICKNKLYSEVWVTREADCFYRVGLKDKKDLYDFYLIQCMDLAEFTQKLRILLFFLKPQIFADFLSHLEFREAPPVQSYTWNIPTSLESSIPTPDDWMASIKSQEDILKNLQESLSKLNKIEKD